MHQQYYVSSSVELFSMWYTQQPVSRCHMSYTLLARVGLVVKQFWGRQKQRPLQSDVTHSMVS